MATRPTRPAGVATNTEIPVNLDPWVDADAGNYRTGYIPCHQSDHQTVHQTAHQPEPGGPWLAQTQGAWAPWRGGKVQLGSGGGRPPTPVLSYYGVGSYDHCCLLLALQRNLEGKGGAPAGYRPQQEPPLDHVARQLSGHLADRSAGVHV